MPLPALLAAAIPAVAGIGGGLIQGLLGKSAADRQAEAQEQATDAQLEQYRLALEEQQRQFDLTREDFAPWQEAGTSALDLIMQGLGPEGMFNQPWQGQMVLDDPGYQFRVQEGQRALERAQSAGGRLQGGRAMREAIRYGQDMGSQEYMNAFNRYQQDLANRFNRLASPARLGMQATGQVAQQGGQTAAQLANIYGRMGNAMEGGMTGAANARAMGTVALGSGINQGIGGLVSGYNQYLMQNALQQPGLQSAALAGGQRPSYMVPQPVMWPGT